MFLRKILRTTLTSPFARIVAVVERLERFPLSGRIVPERRSPSLREVIVFRFRIVYRVSPGTVEIATVFRGEQPFPDVE